MHRPAINRSRLAKLPRSISAFAAVFVSTILVVGVAGSPAHAVAFDYGNVSTGYHRTCAVTSDGRGLCWGWNPAGSLGTGSYAETMLVPATIALPDGQKFRSIEAGAYFMSCGVTIARSVFCWGEGGAATRVVLPAGAVVSQLSVGASQGCAITTDASLYCWGDWSSGELGVGDIEPTNLPVRVTLPDNAVPADVSAGPGFTCAVATSGAAYCWGVNGEGQLGNGRTATSKIPVPVASPVGVSFTRISAGLDRTCALDTTGGGWCWGRNYNGALGDDTYTNSATPRRVALPTGTTLTSLRTGWYHTCAVTTTGSVLCWGDNGSGALGTGSTLGGKTIRAASLPVNVRADTLSAGLAGTCIVTTDRQVLCWGGNLRGSVGLGHTAPAYEPTRILGVGTPDVANPSTPSVATHRTVVTGSVVLNGASGTAALIVADNPSFDGGLSQPIQLARPAGVAGLFSPTAFTSTITSLRPATTYFAKVAVTTPFGRAESNTVEFTTLGARPDVSATTTGDIQGDNVSVGARIGANLLDTSAVVTIARDAAMSRDTRTVPLGSVSADSTSAVALTASVTQLDPLTTYWATVSASNEVGTTTSDVFSFTTRGQAPVAGNLSLTGGRRGGSLRLSVNPGGLDTTVVVAYRPNDPRASWSSAQRTVRGIDTVPVSVDISGLQPASTYSVVVRATNALGSAALPASEFTTLGGAPVVDTPTADPVDDTSATLVAAVDANEFSTRVTLQIDSSESFDNPDEWFAGYARPGDATTIALDVSQLADSTTYFARFVATNAKGTTVGSAVTFTTTTPVGKLLKRRTNPTDPAPAVTPIPVIDLVVTAAAAPARLTATTNRVVAAAIRSQQTKRTNPARFDPRKPRRLPQSPRRR